MSPDMNDCLECEGLEPINVKVSVSKRLTSVLNRSHNSFDQGLTFPPASSASPIDRQTDSMRSQEIACGGSLTAGYCRSHQASSTNFEQDKAGKNCTTDAADQETVSEPAPLLQGLEILW